MYVEFWIQWFVFGIQKDNKSYSVSSIEVYELLMNNWMQFTKEQKNVIYFPFLRLCEDFPMQFIIFKWDVIWHFVYFLGQ